MTLEFKTLKPYFLQLKKLAILSGFALLAIYISLLLLPAISLKYANPYDIKGPSTVQNFNPQTNILRYLFFIILTPLIFAGLALLYKRQKTTILKLIFACSLLLSVALGQLSILTQKMGNIDMFHDGEQLGVGYASYHFGLKPYKDLFFIHGAFFDPLVANTAFHLFGPSIGSLYLLNYILLLIAVALLLFLVIKTVKNNWLYLFTTLFLYCSILLGRLDRDIIVLIYLLILNSLFRNQTSILLKSISLSFISFVAFYLSLDKGYYLFIINLIAFITLCYLHIRSQRRGFIFDRTTQNFIGGFFLGNLFAVITGIIIFGLDGFTQFLKILFDEIPRLKPYLDEFIYPAFSLDKLYPYWWPLIISVLTLIVLTYYFFYRRSLVKNYFYYIAILALLGVISYRYALGRSDIVHILYTVQYIFLAALLLIDYILEHEQSPLKYLIILFVIFQLYKNPFFDLNRILMIPNYRAAEIKFALTLPARKDQDFLTSEQQTVTNYIKQRTSQDDPVLVFTSEAAYYYLLERKSPTRFYTIWFATPSFYQQEALDDLEKNKPKYIIYKSDYFSNTIDGIPNTEKLYRLNQWILANYEEETTINSTIILRPKGTI